MDEEDSITYSQNDLPGISFAAFENMRKRGHLCDVTIKVQDNSFSAHRVVLAAAIPYFENAFSDSAVEIGETEIAVEELDPQAVESLIHFAYTNKIKISIKNAQSLLVASHFLQLHQVRDACSEFLSNRLRIDNVLRLHTFACSLNNADLVENCMKFIKKNFEQFMKSDDFLSLPHSCMKDIISDDDLNVVSEEVVFEALMKWVKASLDERQVTLPNLLCEVRMIYLPIQYVIDQVESEDLIISSKPCRNVVNQVKNYHFLKERRSEFPNLKKRPRTLFNLALYGICECNTCGYSLHCFDLTKGVWSVLASYKKEGGCMSTVIAVNDIIYMFLETTIQTVHLKTREWDILGVKHEQLARAAIVSNGDCIYCFGSHSSDYANKVRCFDTQLNEWLQEGKVSTVRYDHAAAALGDTIYVTGGYNNTRLYIVEKYCTLTGQWSRVTPMLTERDEHGCCSMNERVYVCGGTDSKRTVLYTAEVYDPQTEQWNYVSSMKSDRTRVRLVSYCNKLYAYVYPLKNSGVEEYDPKTGEWKNPFSLPGGFIHAVSGRSVISKSS